MWNKIQNLNIDPQCITVGFKTLDEIKIKLKHIPYTNSLSPNCLNWKLQTQDLWHWRDSGVNKQQRMCRKLWRSSNQTLVAAELVCLVVVYFTGCRVYKHSRCPSHFLLLVYCGASPFNQPASWLAAISFHNPQSGCSAILRVPPLNRMSNCKYWAWMIFAISLNLTPQDNLTRWSIECGNCQRLAWLSPSSWVNPS